MSIDDTPYASPRHESTPSRRVELTLRGSQAGKLEYAQAECGLKSAADVLHCAMTLFLWALSEVKQGKRIAAYDETTDSVEVVYFRAFDKFSPLDSDGLKIKQTFKYIKPPSSWWRRLFGGA